MRSWNSSTSSSRQARCAAWRASASPSSSSMARWICSSKSSAPCRASAVAVAGEDVGEAVHLAVVQRLHLGGVAQAEAGERQRLDPRGHRVGVAPAGEAHQVADDPPDVALVDGAQRGGLGRERLGAVDDRQGDGVERAHLQAAQVGRAGAHLLLRPLVERHQADRAAGNAPALQQVPGALGEHPGLARSGRRDDPRRAAVVGDRGELVGRKVGAGGVVRVERREAAVLDAHPGHDRATVDRRVEARGSAVEPGPPTIGEQDIARPVVDDWLRPEARSPGRAAATRPRRRRWP